MSAAPDFEPLIKLLRGDSAKVQRMLEIYERVTAQDLQQLDQAFAASDWATIGTLAHKMKSACLQVGETAAGTRLAAIERSLPAAACDEAFAKDFAATRDELDRVMMRVAGYLATARGEGER